MTEGHNAMTKIVRTPTKATGGVTDAELAAIKNHSELWISRAMRTTPVNVAEITSDIENLYAVAGLKTPRVVVVPSPLVMAFAYGASAAIWHNRNAAANAAANASNWQWVAGTGVDAPIFSRIMAPLSQSEKFDATGYIKTWVPELAGLSDPYIHDPEEFGVRPPNYPRKIIGHKAARERALAAQALAREK